ncbi:hypothetical protein GUY60_38000, partial [Streptomyces sp. YC537]|nr:hypothetical protein [Streptomyces boluensis]
GGGADGSGDGGAAGDDSGTDADPPADGGSSSSGGGSGSGGEAPSGGVPAAFAGTWTTSNVYGAPAKIEIKQVAPGRQAVSFFRMSPSGGGKVDCVSVARLISVQNGGTRLDLSSATVDTERSTGYGCTAEQASYIDSASASRIEWFSSKDHTSDNNAQPYNRA